MESINPEFRTTPAPYLTQAPPEPAFYVVYVYDPLYVLRHVATGALEIWESVAESSTSTLNIDGINLRYIRQYSEH